MTGFSADWLALREPADARARDEGLTALFASRARLRAPARFVDLACGTGANLRYLAPRIGGEQRWLLVDSDTALLAKAGAESGARPAAVGTEAAVRPAAVRAEPGAKSASLVPGCHVVTRQLDLVSDLHALDFTPDVAVTASALLDLVSEGWLTALVERCREHRCAALFALSYDGRIALTPSDPDDEWIRDLVNRHQLTDKGFGPALGPDAGRRASERFRAAGYEVHTAQSDWNLLPTEQLLQQALLEGWAGAATELAPNDTDRCRSWLARRFAHTEKRTAHVAVGHVDMLALPPG